MNNLQAFQLFLLTEMIRDASISLPPEWNITNDELEAASLQIESLGFGKLPDKNNQSLNWYLGIWYKKILGKPIHEQVDEATGLYSLRYRLPLWPALDFVVPLNAKEIVRDKLVFSRAYDSSTPLLKCANDLKQWAFVKDEIDQRFGPGKENDGWNTFEVAKYTIPNHPKGTMKKYRLWFSYDLLQKIEQEN
jgi:hypothetical protein